MPGYLMEKMTDREFDKLPNEIKEVKSIGLFKANCNKWVKNRID